MTTSPSTKPKTIADVVRLLVAQAVQSGEARYEFRGATYGAKVTADEVGKKSGQVWKMVGGERGCMSYEHLCRAGYETLPHGVIDVATGRSDFYNSIHFNDDGTPVAYGTWRR